MKGWRQHLPFVVDVLVDGRWQVRARCHLAADAAILARSYGSNGRARDARRHSEPGRGVLVAGDAA